MRENFWRYLRTFENLKQNNIKVSILYYYLGSKMENSEIKMKMDYYRDVYNKCLLLSDERKKVLTHHCTYFLEQYEYYNKLNTSYENKENKVLK